MPKTIILTEDKVKELNEVLNEIRVNVTPDRFNANVRYFLHELLDDPVHAEVPTCIKLQGISRSRFIKMLCDRGIVERTERLNDTDKDGNHKPPTMSVKYKVIGKIPDELEYKVSKTDFDRKIEKLRRSIFEKNLPEHRFNSRLGDQIASALGAKTTLGFVAPPEKKHDTVSWLANRAAEAWNAKLHEEEEKKEKFTEEQNEIIKLFNKTLKEFEKYGKDIGDGRSLLGHADFKIDEYGTFTAELYGGCNGPGLWEDYFEVLYRFCKSLEEKDVHIWFIEGKNDCLDDVFYLTFGLRKGRKERDGDSLLSYWEKEKGKKIDEEGGMGGATNANISAANAPITNAFPMQSRKIYNLTEQQIEDLRKLISPEDAEKMGFAVNMNDVKYQDGEFKEPTKTGKAYKVFFLGRDNKLYPPVIANDGGQETPIGKWLPASSPIIVGYTEKDHRPKVASGGKGTRGKGLGNLAFRPGWHMGEIPYAEQFMKRGTVDGHKVWPKELVWAECEYSNDVDYQEKAMSYGYTDNGKFRHSYAGLPAIPKNGSYKYRTNPDPNTVPWVIAGAMKVNKVLSFDEVANILQQHGVEPPLVMSDKEYKAATKDMQEAVGTFTVGGPNTDYQFDVAFGAKKTDDSMKRHNGVGGSVSINHINESKTKKYPNMGVELRKGGRNAVKMSEEDFKEEMKHAYHEYAMEQGLEYVSCDLQPTPTPSNFVYKLCYDNSCNEESKWASMLHKDIWEGKYDFDSENVGAIGGIKMSSKGFPYIQCDAGGDWECPVCFFVYFDGTHFRGYIPLKGNALNRVDNHAFSGGGNENDAKFIAKEFGIGEEEADGMCGDISYNVDACLEDFLSRVDVNGTYKKRDFTKDEEKFKQYRDEIKKKEDEEKARREAEREQKQQAEEGEPDVSPNMRDLEQIVNEVVNEVLNEAKRTFDKFLEEHGIEEKSVGLGFSEKEQKWYGWSHRAVHGFGIGDKFRECYPHETKVGKKIETLEQAKEAAIKFADSVS